MTNSAAAGASSRPSDAARVMSLIDLTDLNDAHAPDALDELVRRALEFGVPAVCVWPEFVAQVAGLLDFLLRQMTVAIRAGQPVKNVVDQHHGFRQGAVKIKKNRCFLQTH